MTGPGQDAGRWEVAVAAGAMLGERPVWDAAAGCLAWVDIHAGRLHRHWPGSARAGGASGHPGSDEILVELDVPVGAAAPRAGGGYVLAAGDGFRLVDGAGRPEAGPIRPADMAGDLRFNDGACDPAGRFWAGTVALDVRPGAGALYRLDPDRSVHRVLGGVTESNGLGWSPDGGTFYYIDSGEPQPRIRAFGFDVPSGALGAARDLIRLPPGAEGSGTSVPDGLVVDAEGCLWVAIWGGGQVRRYAPDGGLLASLSLPVTCPTCPAFGGPELEDLYVTSAWEGMGEAQRAAQPLAGHVLRTRPGARGQEVCLFGG